MNIVILTHPPMKNYGGILQALALSTVCREFGHDVTILNGPLKKLSPLKMIDRKVKFFFGADKEKIYTHLKRFCGERLPLSSPWYGKTVPECDCIIVGSDQVWRPEYTHLPGSYFLDFLPDESRVRRIAYAASFGVDQWAFSPEQTEEYGKLLRKFFAVSVRETSGIALCREHWQVSAAQMPDPTLLHDEGFYRRTFIADNGVPAGEKRLFSYFLNHDPEKETLADSLAKEADLIRDDFLSPDKKSLMRPVEEFIRGIAGASFVLTDSFHGMVFSMIFGVPFAVIGNRKRGLARFELLARSGIPDVLLSETGRVKQCLKLLAAPERNSSLKEFLAGERIRGRRFLAESLQIQ